jgi:hypothetical protein
VAEDDTPSRIEVDAALLTETALRLDKELDASERAVARHEWQISVAWWLLSAIAAALAYLFSGHLDQETRLVKTETRLEMKQ